MFVCKQDLRARLRAAEADRDEVLTRGKEFVGRVRAQSVDLVSGRIKSVMERLYADTAGQLSQDAIYDGAQVLAHLRNNIKTVTQAFLSEQ
jgi:hypothetical protein